MMTIYFRNNLLALVLCCQTLGHAIIVESKPIDSGLSLEQQRLIALEEHREFHLEYQAYLEQKINELIDLSEQNTHKIDYLKSKIDSLEKQQRDFLSLISDVVMQPQESMCSQEHKEYQLLLDLMKAQQYTQAIKGMQKFSNDYPHSEKIPHVYCWMGEIYTLDNHLEQANECFTFVVENYPKHHKSAEALFKIGQIDLAQGNIDNARKKWADVIARYPQSHASQLAKKNMAKIDQNGTKSG